MQVKLTSADDKEFVVDKATLTRKVAERSVLIKNMIEDVGEDGGTIPLPNVRSHVLERVLNYCEHHKNDVPPASGEDEEAPKKTEDVSAWDAEFIKVDNNDTLFELILAANYLDIKPLLDLGCKTVASMIRGKTPQQIRDMFNIENDFTPEEEEQIRKENAWALSD